MLQESIESKNQLLCIVRPTPTITNDTSDDSLMNSSALVGYYFAINPLYFCTGYISNSWHGIIIYDCIDTFCMDTFCLFLTRVISKLQYTLHRPLLVQNLHNCYLLTQEAQ